MATAGTVSQFAAEPGEFAALASAASVNIEPDGDGRETLPASLDSTQFDRNQAVLSRLHEVRVIAGRIHRRLPAHVELEDLVQAGMLGLVDAVERVDPSRKVSPDQYIRIRVTGAIFDSLRGQDWLSRYMRTRQQNLSAAAERAQSRLGRSVTAEDVADELHMDLDSYFEFASAVRELRKIDAKPLPDEDFTPDAAELLPASEDARPDCTFFKHEMKEVLGKVLDSLPRDERQVLRLYYFEEWTMRAIAARIHRTESRVSQIHAKALRHVAMRLEPHPHHPRLRPGRTRRTARQQ